MKRIFIYLVMAFCFIYSNAYLVDKAYYNYADSLKKSSDTIVYRLMEKEAIKRDLNDNTAPLVYMRPGYSVQIPALAVMYPYNLFSQRQAYVLPEGGVVAITFTNKFDNKNGDDIEILNLPKADVIQMLEGLKAQLEDDLENKFNKPYGYYKKIYWGAQSSEEYYYDAFKDTIRFLDKKVGKMLKGHKAEWSNNNLRVRKGMFIIDFMFIRDDLYGLLQKVVSSLKAYEMTDSEVDASNAYIFKYYHNNPMEMPQHNEWR